MFAKASSMTAPKQTVIVHPVYRSMRSPLTIKDRMDKTKGRVPKIIITIDIGNARKPELTKMRVNEALSPLISKIFLSSRLVFL